MTWNRRTSSQLYAQNPSADISCFLSDQEILNAYHWLVKQIDYRLSYSISYKAFVTMILKYISQMGLNAIWDWLLISSITGLYFTSCKKSFHAVDIKRFKYKFSWYQKGETNRLILISELEVVFSKSNGELRI